ncbi:putative bifunctional diguanylate cyclase/phosphodiesterase [Thioalkalivibrio halophilus]|uniref:cyclic-guanylate-specific phosphodiesterase n=1 Tax=Thioalkalivibrio halophilus TaxID=252474 RepID=A0A1V2ZXR4_9GAMM|nr:EAL domain-containing protein [Thioalkalivibrio halophilus]OOC09917.1 GGDEF domain-containing protein [Thioalkalivibrio halophilus]
MFSRSPVFRLSPAALIALGYLVAGSLWVALSDMLFMWSFGIEASLTRVSLLKGLGFVWVSGGLLYLAMRTFGGRRGARTRNGGGLTLLRGRQPWVWVAMAVAVAGSVGGVAFGTFHIAQATADQQVREELRATAFLKGGLVDRWMAERAGDARILADARGFTAFVRSLQRHDSEVARTTLENRLQAIRTAYGYRSVAILGAEEHAELLVAGDASFQRAAARAARVEAMQTGAVSRAHVDAVDDAGATRLHWAAPLHHPADRDSEPLAVVLFSADLDRLAPLLGAAIDLEDGDAATWLVSHPSDRAPVVMRLDGESARRVEPPAEFAQLESRLLRGGSGEAVRIGSLGEEDDGRLAAVRGLELDDWSVVVKRDRAPLVAGAHRQAAWTGGALLLVWLLMAGAGALVGRQQWLQRNLRLMQSHSEQDRLLRVFFDMPFVGMAVSGPGGQGWERVNDCLGDMLGYRPEELAKLDWDRLAHPEDRSLGADLDREMREGRRDGYEVEKRLLRADGSVMVAHLSLKCTRHADGSMDRVVVTVEDITRRREEEERRRLASVVFENTREGVVITDSSAHILSVNRAFTELMGYTQDEVVGHTPRMFQSGRHDRTFYQNMFRQLELYGHWQGEIWNRRKNGEVFPELQSITAVHDPQGRRTHYVSVFADISRIKASEEELDYLAHHDPLTELPNRRLLLARLGHGVSLMRRRNGVLALLIVDLDRFKDVNDSHGHAAGDSLLRTAAIRLQRERRGTDTVARLAADEFAVVVENLGHPDDAGMIAESMIRHLAEPCDLGNGVEVEVVATVGIALFPDHGAGPEALLQQAGTALSRAKEEGRGSYRYYSDAYTEAARERIDLSSRLRRAMENDHLEVHYQPQYEIATGRLIGAEALLRWNDPVLGRVSPGRFIPVAEKTGLIVELGTWVLQEVIRQGRAWLDAGYPPIRLAVNVSALQFRRMALDEQVVATLDEHGLPPECLELEITESALMADAERARRILESLRDRGVHFAVDDFGTGYSSLSQLKSFAVDTLKIDKSFVDGIAGVVHEDDVHDRSITTAIVAMAHGLGLTVVAEGVETAEQLEALCALSCDFYQGYFASRPIPVAEFERDILATSEQGG